MHLKANTNIEITKKNKKKGTIISQVVKEMDVGNYGKTNGGKGNLVSLQYFPGCPKINVLNDISSDAELGMAFQGMNPKFNSNFGNGSGFWLMGNCQNYGDSGPLTIYGYSDEAITQQDIANWSPRSRNRQHRSSGALHGFTPGQHRGLRHHSMFTISEGVEQCEDDGGLVMGLPEPAMTATEQMRHERILPYQGAMDHRAVARACSETSNN